MVININEVFGMISDWDLVLVLLLTEAVFRDYELHYF